MSVKLRSKKLSNGTESFYLDIYHKGKREYEFIDVKIYPNDPQRKAKKIIADNIRAQKELDIPADAYNIPKFYKDEDFLAFYLSKVRDISFKSSYNKLKEFSQNKMSKGILPFRFVDEKFCEDYKEWLLERISNNTTWVYIYKLKAVLNKAVKEKKILYNPSKFVSIKNEESERIYLTLDEIKLLNDAECENPELKRAFLFSCFTGLRSSDIKNLTWGQIRENKMFFRQKKTRGFEYLPLSEAAIKILYSNNPDNVIPLPENKVFDLKIDKSGNIGKFLRKWAKTVKIDKYLTFHSARHTFATLSLTYGIDLYTVSKLLGHKSINTTQIYAKVINEKVNQAVKMLPNL
jgi:integrase